MSIADREFRWKFSDDVVGEHWSKWHIDVEYGECTGCCCNGGPDADGEHQEPAEFNDPDGGYTTSHSYFTPGDPESWVEVEWR